MISTLIFASDARELRALFGDEAWLSRGCGGRSFFLCAKVLGCCSCRLSAVAAAFLALAGANTDFDLCLLSLEPVPSALVFYCACNGINCDPL